MVPNSKCQDIHFHHLHAVYWLPMGYPCFLRCSPMSCTVCWRSFKPLLTFPMKDWKAQRTACSERCQKLSFQIMMWGLPYYCVSHNCILFEVWTPPFETLVPHGWALSCVLSPLSAFSMIDFFIIGLYRSTVIHLMCWTKQWRNVKGSRS